MKKSNKKKVSKQSVSHKNQGGLKYKPTSQITVDYFPRGGSATILDKKSKKASSSEDPEFLFNKAPVTLVKRKRKKPYEMNIPDVPEKKKKKIAEEDFEDKPMLESGLLGKESLDITRIRRLVNTL